MFFLPAAAGVMVADRWLTSTMRYFQDIHLMVIRVIIVLYKGTSDNLFEVI